MLAFTRPFALPAAIAALALVAATVMRSSNSAGVARRPDVIFVPTPVEVVRGMLELADVTSNDVVYDLGSGDGRIVIAAAKDFGARGVGIELDPEVLADARANLEDAKVSDLVTLRQGDFFDADLADASVVALYLTPSINERLISILNRRLKPGTRVVSHAFGMGDIPPLKTTVVDTRHIYLWKTPLK